MLCFRIGDSRMSTKNCDFHFALLLFSNTFWMKFDGDITTFGCNEGWLRNFQKNQSSAELRTRALNRILLTIMIIKRPAYRNTCSEIVIVYYLCCEFGGYERKKSKSTLFICLLTDSIKNVWQKLAMVNAQHSTVII